MKKSIGLKLELKSVLIAILSYLIPIIGIWRIIKSPKKSVGYKIIGSIVYMIFWTYTFTLLYAMWFAFYNSAKTNGEFYENMVNLPNIWHLENYIKAFENIKVGSVGLPAMFINSLWYSLGSAALSALMHAFTGYVFAKYEFPGKNIAFAIIIFTITLPVVGNLPSLYQIVKKMGIDNSPLFLITTLGGFSGNFLITYGFYKGVDKTYMEAARMDGAGHWTTFTKIMLPQAVPVMVAIGILTFIGQWNNYETAILFMDKMPPLSVGLFLFKKRMVYDIANSSMPVYLAGVLLCALPVIILIAIFHKKIIENVSVGGIKG